MEPKAIIYIIGGIIYFLYTMKKKMDENKKASSSADTTETAPKPKPVTPPATNPLEEVMREIKRKQAELEMKKKLASQRPQPVQTKPQTRVVQGKDIFIQEKKSATFGQGAADEPVYERTAAEKEKVFKRGDIRLENEGIYRVQTMEEARTASDEAGNSEPYEFDAKQAFIGSVIFERKY